MKPVDIFWDLFLSIPEFNTEEEKVRYEKKLDEELERTWEKEIKK